MSYRLIDLVLGSSITDATEFSVMIALASHADKYCSCYPSIQRLCEVSRYKDRAVQGAIKRLAARGIITVKTGGGRGGASFYTIIPSALNPAADASITAPKPRSKNTVSDDNTPQQMRETPHLTTENPAADADEPVIEPVKKHSLAARDQIGVMQERIVEALGLTGREFTTSGTFVVKGMDVHNLTASLEVWAKHGLTDDQIILAIRAKLEVERSKSAGFMPGSLKFFDGPIADFAKRIDGGTGAKTAPKEAEQAPLSDPQAEAERQSLWDELDRLRGSNSDKAFSRRGEIIARLQALQTQAA